jgi:hypothetical protein
MKALLWRVLYAVICVVIALLIIPLFLQVVGFPVSGQVEQLLKLVIACLAVLYVFFGPPPPMPW